MNPSLIVSLEIFNIEIVVTFIIDRFYKIKLKKNKIRID